MRSLGSRSSLRERIKILQKGLIMSTIAKKYGQVALINTFTVEPSNIDALVEELNEATEKVMSKRPGFVSANIHRSLDGRHVANYAQWNSKADFDAMLNDPASREHRDRLAKIASSVSPILYTVDAVHGGEASGA